MEKPCYLSLLSFALAIAFVAGSCSAQQLQPCNTQSVTYAPFDENFAERITMSDHVMVGIVGQRQFSPQKTRWLVASQPDYSQPGPWSSFVSINTVKGNTSTLLAFKDHGNGGVQMTWLNEKLVYGSVWWGRIVSTDFVFDVENKKFIYREMANYGELIQPRQR